MTGSTTGCTRLELRYQTSCTACWNHPTQTPLVPLDILGFHREVMQNDGRRNNRAVWGWPSFLARAIWLTHWTVNKPQGRKHSEEMSVVIHYSGLRMLSMGWCWEMLLHVTSSCGQKLQWHRNPGGSWEAPLGWGGLQNGPEHHCEGTYVTWWLSWQVRLWEIGQSQHQLNEPAYQRDMW